MPHFECGAFDHSATSPGRFEHGNNPRSRFLILSNISPMNQKPFHGMILESRVWCRLLHGAAGGFKRFGPLRGKSLNPLPKTAPRAAFSAQFWHF